MIKEMVITKQKSIFLNDNIVIDIYLNGNKAESLRFGLESTNTARKILHDHLNIGYIIDGMSSNEQLLNELM